MTYVDSLFQIPKEKQIWKLLQYQVFDKKFACPDCGRKAYVQELQKHKMWRCTKGKRIIPRA